MRWQRVLLALFFSYFAATLFLFIILSINERPTSHRWVQNVGRQTHTIVNISSVPPKQFLFLWWTTVYGSAVPKNNDYCSLGFEFTVKQIN